VVADPAVVAAASRVAPPVVVDPVVAAAPFRASVVAAADPAVAAVASATSAADIRDRALLLSVRECTNEAKPCSQAGGATRMLAPG
jgi:hypothetical protein